MSAAIAAATILIAQAAAADGPLTTAALSEMQALGPMRVVRYGVEGRDARAVRSAMNRARPGDPQGRETDRFDGRTDWTYATRWRKQGVSEAEAACVPSSAEVDVALTVTLPQLVQTGRLGARDAARFDAYLAALVRHEANHVRLALAGAERMRAALRQASDCAGMTTAQALVSDEVGAASVQYDRTTEHGRREGASFP